MVGFKGSSQEKPASEISRSAKEKPQVTKRFPLSRRNADQDRNGNLWFRHVHRLGCDRASTPVKPRPCFLCRASQDRHLSRKVIY